MIIGMADIRVLSCGDGICQDCVAKLQNKRTFEGKKSGVFTRNCIVCPTCTKYSFTVIQLKLCHAKQ
jgi:hypothetical protein